MGEFEKNFPYKITGFGFVGTINGGFCNHFRLFYDKLYYHQAKYVEELDERIWFEYDAIDVLKRILNKERFEYTGEDFAYLNSLNEYLKSDLKYEWHYPRYIVLKKEIKEGRLLRSKAIRIAIEIFKLKANKVW